ncbi:MAG: hypothetical protein WA705_26085 [Candidatus Ozemobacteraceae bacterium]
MKKVLGVVLCLAMVAGMVFVSGCGSDGGIGAIIGGAIFFTLIVTATGGAGAPVAFAASQRETARPAIFSSSKSREMLRFRISKMKNGMVDLTASAAIILGEVVNDAKGFQGSIKVESTDQMLVELVASDTNKSILKTVLAPTGIQNDQNVPVEVNPESSAKTLLYEKWVASGPSNVSIKNFDANVASNSLDAQVRKLGQDLQVQFLANKDNLATYTPLTDKVVLDGVASIAPKITLVDLTNTVPVTTLAGNWNQLISNAPFSSRDCFTTIVYQNKLWLFGGWEGYTKVSSGTMKGDVWSSSDGMNWTLVNANPAFTPRHVYGSVVFNNQMWIVGGRGTSSSYGDAWSSSDGVTWTQQCSSIGISGEIQCAVLNGKIYAFSDSTIVSSSDGTTWTTETSSPAYGTRSSYGLTAFSGKLWIVGGGNQIEPTSPSARMDTVASPTQAAYLSDVWSSADGKSWTQEIATASFSPRKGLMLMSDEGRMLLAGGWVGRGASNSTLLKNDVYTSTDGKTWTQATPNAGFAPRSAAGFVKFNSAYYMIGGFIGGVNDGGQWIQFMTNDVWSSK